MNHKRRILVVEHRDTWRIDLHQALADAARVHAVGTYDESLAALKHEAFDLAVVDLWLDAPLDDYDTDDDGTHDCLEIILEVAKRAPTTQIVVISEGISYETLRHTPGVPATALFVERARFDPEHFATQIDRILEGQPLADGPLKVIGTAPNVYTGLLSPAIGERPGRPRILIIEDQRFWQDTLARLMEDEGYFWRVASSHEQALGHLRLESFHVVLFNLTLGDPASSPSEHEGWLLLDYLVNRCPKTRLIVVSGHLSSADVARLFMGYPIKGYVDKNSFDRGQLLDLIRAQVTGPRLRINTLGDFRIWRDGKLINDLGIPLAETAVKLLLTRCGEWISADEMIHYLWPGADPKSHYARLREVINSARLALEPDLPHASDSRVILREGGNYRLDITANVEIDSEQLKRWVAEGRQQELEGNVEGALQAYQRVNEIYQGDYLPADRAQSWTMQERVALQALYTSSLNRMADLYARQGKLESAIKAANLALQTDAYAEATYRRLMRYHACAGDKQAALTVYKALVKLFSEFISEEPGPATKRLRDDIEAGRSVECVEPG